MPASVEESIADIFHALTFLDKLQTAPPSKLVSVVLSPPSTLENGWIRDAQEHEVGLYTQRHGVDGDEGHASNSNHLHHPVGTAIGSRQDVGAERVNKLRRSLLGRSVNNNAGSRSNGVWTFKQRPAPHAASLPPQATPLRRGKPQGGDATLGDQKQPLQQPDIDAEVYLLAAQKLLMHYPSAGSSEHIKLLSSQYEGLVESIADLEESLKKQQQQQRAAAPSSTANVSNAIPVLGAVSADITQLEQDIKREELEILALKSQLAEQTVKKIKSPAKSAMVKSAMTATETPRRRKLSIPSKAAEPTTAIAKTHPKPPPKPARSSIAEGIVALKRSQGISSVSSARTGEGEDKAKAAAVVASPVRGKSTTVTQQTSGTSNMPIPPVQSKLESAKPKGAVSDTRLTALVGKIKAVLPPSATAGIVTPLELLAKLEELRQPSNSSEQPSLILEYSLLHIYFSLIIGHTLTTEDEVVLILRPSTINASGSEQDAMLSMSVLKSTLGRIAVSAGWAEDMGTKAIYGLVAKRILRIDRRGREALVAFT